MRVRISCYETLIAFRSELAENDTPAGVMVNAPAMVRGTYGLGRGVRFPSPHPEQTAGLEPLVEKAIRWSARARTQLKSFGSGSKPRKSTNSRCPASSSIEDRFADRPADQGRQEQTYPLQPVRGSGCSTRLAIPSLRPPEHGAARPG
jgi:hypothetical protein